MCNDSRYVTRSVIESVAGFAAGIISTLVAHPLDVVKTRLQLEHEASTRIGNSLRIIRDIVQNEGTLKAFYRGLTPNLVGNSASWAFYFVCYDRVKYGLGLSHGPSVGLTYYDYFLASATAGTLTALCTNPIWVIKTRMLSTSSAHPGAYKSVIDGTRRIYHDEGVRGFYRGLIPSLFGVSHAAMQFMAYEMLKLHRKSSIKDGELSTTDYLVLSGLAKVFAGSITYPYQLVRTRLQMYNADSMYTGVRDVITQVMRKEGLPGFYKGLGPNLVRVMPSTWVTFLVYEKTRLYLQTVASPAP